jgi:uncharacterized protein (TIGR00369 family)
MGVTGPRFNLQRFVIFTSMFNPEIQQRVAASFARQRLMALYGATITGMDAGFIEMTVPAADALLRTSGMFHGGVVAALADSAGGYAATTLYAEDASFLTVELKINYLRPAKGDRLIARGRVIKGGATLTVVQSDLYTVERGSERHVATTLITFIRETKQ